MQKRKADGRKAARIEIYMDGESVLPFEGTIGQAIERVQYIAKSVIATFEVIEFTPDNQEGTVRYNSAKDS
ncbi:MAG: hypothetical protein Q8L10_00360 [Candidatus Moranbacteria bacterium]|nr:hypothetical protein [Candidatus Moranbacteria bacterium]